MPSPIAASSAGTARIAPSAALSAPPSPTALQAQLQRFEQQLSDCVNCASAHTPRGKSDIAAISARISQVQQRLADAAGASPQAQAQVPAPAPAPAVNVRPGTIDVYA